MKRIIYGLLWYIGVFHLMRYINRKKVTILMLHGVAGMHPDSGWQPLWPRLSPHVLDQVLGELGRYYNFVSLEDAVAMISGARPVIDNALVLTFDDGYRNNLTEALPVLKKHQAPGTFFVSTGFVGTRKAYWIDRLDYALQKAPDSARYIKEGRYEFDLRNCTRGELMARYRDLRLAIKGDCNDDYKMLDIFDSIAGSLERAAGATVDDIIDDDPYASIASWHELQSALQGGAGIGSHTVDHVRLDTVDEGQIDDQLTRSKAEIEDRLGIRCAFFCYPNGNFNDLVRSRTRKAGYDAAVTTTGGLNAVGDDLYTLKRLNFPARGPAIGNLFAISGIHEIGLIRRVLDAGS